MQNGEGFKKAKRRLSRIDDQAVSHSIKMFLEYLVQSFDNPVVAYRIAQGRRSQAHNQSAHKTKEKLATRLIPLETASMFYP